MMAWRDNMVNHPSRSKTCRPREHLRAAAQLYPAAWKQFEQFRVDRGRDLPDWPEWCFCPLAGAYAIVSGGGDNRLGPELAGDVGRLGALAAWRMTQGIYRFDPVLYDALVKTPISGDLPAELLYRLPEWCVYIETPGLGCMGVFVHLEHDGNTGRAELRLLVDDDRGLTPYPLHLGEWPLSEAVERAVAESRRQAVASGNTIAAVGLSSAGVIESVADAVAPIVSMVLYLCSEQPDIDGQPMNPQPKRTRHGWRLFPADNPRTWDVGVRLGAALRNAALQQDTGKPAAITGPGRTRPRAHVRVAHWHTYLTGQGRINRVLRWIPPVPVNVDNQDALAASIRSVKP